MGAYEYIDFNVIDFSTIYVVGRVHYRHFLLVQYPIMLKSFNCPHLRARKKSEDRNKCTMKPKYCCVLKEALIEYLLHVSGKAKKRRKHGIRINTQSACIFYLIRCTI